VITLQRKKVVLSGAGGRMGSTIGKGLFNAEDIELVGAVDPGHAGEDFCKIIQAKGNLIIESDLAETLSRVEADVLVDFSTPRAVLNNCLTALSRQVKAVVGTTGLNETDYDRLFEACEKYRTPALVAPNFALGAVLMMNFAVQAAKYLPDAEIIELHHRDKLDAPSGTAIKTKTMIENENPGASVKIHSVRLPGLVAHQEVLFGGQGQTLTIRHDSMSRESFIPGVLMAVRKIDQVQGLVVGLEKIIDF